MASVSARSVTQTELAALLGLSTRQIRNLEAEGIPFRSDGRRKEYPVPDAIRWYVGRKQEEAERAVERTDYEEALARKTLAEARRAELQLAELEGSLIPRALAEQMLGRVLERIRSRLTAIPGVYSTQLAGLSPRALVQPLRRMVQEVLGDLSGSADEIVRDPRREEVEPSFPASGYLREAGIELYAELLEIEDLRSIPGIGPARATQIERALSRLGLSPEVDS